MRIAGRIDDLMTGCLRTNLAAILQHGLKQQRSQAQ